MKFSPQQPSKNYKRITHQQLLCHFILLLSLFFKLPEKMFFKNRRCAQSILTRKSITR